MGDDNRNTVVSKSGNFLAEERSPEDVVRETTKLFEKEMRSILKNVIVVSIAFMVLFTCYNSMENMQSSINRENGTISLAALYIGFLFSGCFLPTLVLNTLREKYSLALCAFCFSTYMAAQFHPKLYLLVPTGVLLGLAAAVLWSAKGTYITKVGKRYAYLSGERSNVVITRFFTIFYMFYLSTQVWGNLLSSSVLSVGVDDAAFNKSEEELLLCGYNYCINDLASTSEVSILIDSSENISSFSSSSLFYSTFNSSSSSAYNSGSSVWQIYVLSSVYVSGAIMASLIILFFLDPIKSSGDEEVKEKSTLKLLVATFNHLRHPYQVLMIPLTIWSGVERAFLGADFTAAFVSCGLGIHMVGYIMICYGICGVLGSMSASHAVKIFGRMVVVVFAFLINASVIVTFIYWTPHPDEKACFFILSGLWGLADAVWQTQVNSLYGVLFPTMSEAAFSNCRLWEATGFTIAFGCSSFLCFNYKIIIITLFLLLGVTCYYIIEVIEKVGGLPKDKDNKIIPIDKLISRLT